MKDTRCMKQTKCVKAVLDYIMSMSEFCTQNKYYKMGWECAKINLGDVEHQVTDKQKLIRVFDKLDGWVEDSETLYIVLMERVKAKNINALPYFTLYSKLLGIDYEKKTYVSEDALRTAVIMLLGWTDYR